MTKAFWRDLSDIPSKYSRNLDIDHDGVIARLLEKRELESRITELEGIISSSKGEDE